MDDKALKHRRKVEVAGLRSKLQELEETLNAIRTGEVDALIVDGPNGQHVFSLRGAEQPYRVFVEQMREGAVTLAQDGSILYANKRFAELVGRPLEGIISSQFRIYVHESSVALVDKMLLKPSGQGEDLDMVGAQGRQIPVRASFNTMSMAESEAICLVITDLTEQRERKLLDQTLVQLRESQETLRTQFDSLARAAAAIELANASKDRFLAALSHELRTPLTPVLMTVGALADNAKLPGPIREELRMVRRNVELEARLIDDLLDLTSITQNKMTVELKPVDLHQVLTDVIEICRSEANNKRLKIKTSFKAKKSHVSADHVRLQQILWNVIRNAVKFTPENGKIEISTLSSGSTVEVSVADTGIGIPPDMLSRIFNAFEQGGKHITRQFGGLGLGLAISHKLALLHGGTLSVASKGEQKGAKFTLTLPTIGVPHHQKKDARIVPSKIVPLRILLVEDHDDTRRNMARLLTAMKHKVLVAQNAAEALELAASSKLDLVISDLGLPDRSGLDLMKDLRKDHGLKGICLSGYGMEGDILKSQAAGFSKHLTKPINMDRLEHVIREVTNPEGHLQSAEP